MKEEKETSPQEYDISGFAARLPVSVVVPTRNEAANIGRCLESVRGCDEVFVVDSQSTDGTVGIAESFSATVLQFHYHGGWPKKRQWALDNLSFHNDWVLLLDADECLSPELAAELYHITKSQEFEGYRLRLQMEFLGRVLRHGGSEFSKLSFFRRGHGRFECRLSGQDESMGDMEVHEHVIVQGRVGAARNPLLHRNINSLAQYISKHNQYSNWEARVLIEPEIKKEELPAQLLGTQAQRRMWLKKKLYAAPGSPLVFFLYKYLLRLGILDGVPGLIFCALQAIQLFHTKAKIYELQLGNPAVKSPLPGKLEANSVTLESLPEAAMTAEQK